MRISDWSSDVCSSDLRRSRVRRAVEHARRPADRSTEGAASVARAPGYRDRRPRCRSRAAGSAGREEDRVPQALVDHGGAHRPAFLHRADEASRTRSEEHTSELQSLMRISYAVFCLKKKRKMHKISRI